MIEYVKDIVIPYVKKAREIFDKWKPALIIINNFKGQTTDEAFDILEADNIHFNFCLPIQQIVFNPWMFVLISLS